MEERYDPQNIIELDKGTARKIYVTIYDDDGEVFVPGNGVVCKLGVKHDPGQTSYDIIKTGTYDSTDGCYVIKTGTYDSTDGCYVFTLTASDTSSLQSKLYGERYWYDVGIKMSNGDPYKPITSTPFILYSGVTDMTEVSS